MQINVLHAAFYPPIISFCILFCVWMLKCEQTAFICRLSYVFIYQLSGDKCHINWKTVDKSCIHCFSYAWSAALPKILTAPDLEQGIKKQKYSLKVKRIFFHAISQSFHKKRLKVGNTHFYRDKTFYDQLISNKNYVVNVQFL